MTTQPEQTIDSKLAELMQFNERLNSSIPKLEVTKPKRRYDIEVDDDTHWELVRIAARQKLHQEDFVEQLLVEFVAEHRAAMALRKGIEEAAS
jgi:predicted dienelactone hydrolase